MSDTLERHGVPADVDPDDWQLAVTGAVGRPLELTIQELRSIESFTGDFACVQGRVATYLDWWGIRGRDLLELAECRPRGRYGLVSGMDGDDACALPVDSLAMGVLAVELDGDPLPVERGWPARFVPVGDDADCWESVKWVSEIAIREDLPDEDDTARDLALGRIDRPGHSLSTRRRRTATSPEWSGITRQVVGRRPIRRVELIGDARNLM